MNDYNSQTESSSVEQSAELNGVPPDPSFRVVIANEQSMLSIDKSQLQTAVATVVRESAYQSGTVSIALVDDPTIHEINRQYLGHDYPTDVLSFVLEDRQPYLEGELVVSTDTASAGAVEYEWPASSELLLYVIHGALHLVGFRDKKADEATEMRAAEAQILRKLGVALPNDASRWSDRAANDDRANGTARESAREPARESAIKSVDDLGGEACSS